MKREMIDTNAAGTVTLIQITLTDGSLVFNVRIEADEDRYVELACPDYRHARLTFLNLYCEDVQ
jgi:hypothetical protein